MKKIIITIILGIILVCPIAFANGDVDGNGIIEFEDLIIIATNFGKTSDYEDGTDTDNNGVIDIFDVVYVATRIGTEIEPPEPPPPPDENLVYAASLSPSDIKDAVDSANPGDIVVLPAGTYNNFDTTVYIPNGISMRGQGKDSTVITRNSGGYIFYWNYDRDASSFPVEISDFKLIGIGGGNGNSGVGIRINEMQDVKIHDLELRDFPSSGVWFVDSRGVIYNSYFYDIYPQDLGQSGYGVSVEGDDVFGPDPVFGSQDFVFIEDNYFEHCKHGVALYGDGRYVVRNNEFHTPIGARFLVDVHGKQPQHDSGSRAYEIYDNKLYGSPSTTEDWGMGIRGGDGVIWNNQMFDLEDAGTPPHKAIGLTIDDHGTYPQDYPDLYQIKDLYIWGNKLNENSLDTARVTSLAWDWIKEDREYFMYQKPDYTPYPYPHPLRGGTADNVVYASGCSRNDIQAAVNSASVGDVVELPSCTYNSFSGTVTIPAGVELRGQGASQTILRRSSPDSSPLIEFDCSNGEEAKFSKIKLQGTYTQGTTEKGLYLDNCKNFRVWNSEFEDFTHACIYAMGYSYGVIWDSTIKDCYTPGYGYGVKVDGTNPGEWSPDMGDFSWSRPLGLGGQDAVYVEDCTLSNNRHNVDANMGGRFVVRYNTITGNAADGQMIATHGETSAGNRGTRKFEIYNNVFNHVSQPYSIYPMAGEGVVFNNVINNIGNPVNWFIISHPCTDQPPDCTAWPEVDQVTNLYIWGNTVNGMSRNYPRISDHALPYDLFIEGRDWFSYQMPGYTAYPYPHPLRST